MPTSQQALRSQRDAVLAQIQQIDHLRRGSLSRQFFQTRRAGKLVESGPYFVLQSSLQGKKCSQRIPAAQAEAVAQQVENYRRFTVLAEEFVTLSDQITQAESAPDGVKKAERLAAAECQAERGTETQAFVALVKRQWEQRGVSNLEAVELGLRAALFKDGRAALEQLVQSAAKELTAAQLQPGEKCHADRPRTVDTIFGTIHLQRDYLYSPTAHQGRCPLDEALGLIDGTSPGLVHLASRAAAREGFEGASDDLKELAGIHVDGRQIQRLVAHSGPQVAAQLKRTGPMVETKPMPICYVEADGTGIPMLARELIGRKGKQADGTAKTREVKLGCVFSQTTTDAAGQPLRDHLSTSYVGTLQPVASFAPLLRDEARRRGIGQAQKIVFLGDGAAWIWELARTHFPTAILMLDFYHMMEYLHELSQLLYGPDTAWAGRMKTQWKAQMEQDEVAAVLAALNQRVAQLGETAAETVTKIHEKIRYLEHHQDKMKYGTFRAQGLFYGSGVVEAGCRAVIGKRLKQSGMHWTEVGAENILALRCALKSHRWDECWEQINHSRQFQTQLAARPPAVVTNSSHTQTPLQTAGCTR